MTNHLKKMLLWAGVPLFFVGVYRSRIWIHLLQDGVFDPFVIGLTVLSLATLVGWKWKQALATKILLLWFLLLVFFAGVLPVLAVMLLAAAMLVVGEMILPRDSAVLQVVLGIILLAGTVGWLLFLPIHYGWSYALLCCALIGWRWKSLIFAVKLMYLRWNEAVAASPGLATFCLLVIGLATVSIWLPVMQFDELGYHLELPWQLYEEGFYTPRLQYQIWALAPWLADIVQSLAMLMSAQEAVGAVNALWACCLVCGLWQLSSVLKASVPARWLSATAGISMPATAALAMGMQTELPTAALLVWLFAWVARPADGNLRFWLVTAILTGGLVALKLTSAMMAMIPLLWAVLRHPLPPLSKIRKPVAIGAALASSSYFYSWFITGNPVLPFFNGWFHSPFFDLFNFMDERWNAGLNWKIFWNISFYTNNYVEAAPGYFGFLLIVLFGVWLYSLFCKNIRTTSLLASIVFLLLLVPLQYVRYAYPGFMVLSAVLVVTACTIHMRHAVWIISGLCMLHLFFQGNAHWILHGGVVRDIIFAQGKKEPVLEKYAPERLIAARIRSDKGSSGNVMALSSPVVAEFGVRGRVAGWYAHALSKEVKVAEQDATGQSWAGIFQREEIQNIILRDTETSPAQLKGLQRIGATRHAVVEGVEWWKIPEKNR